MASSHPGRFVGSLLQAAPAVLSLVLASAALAGTEPLRSGTVEPDELAPAACDFVVRDRTTGLTLAFESSTGTYFATAGQILRFEGSDLTATPTWYFGNGDTGWGNPVDYAYALTQSSPQRFQTTMTTGSCARSHDVFVSPAALSVGWFTASNTSPPVGTAVAFSCGGAGGVSPYLYRFDFGDGYSKAFSSSGSASHTYFTVGGFYATCQVTDAAGGSSQRLLVMSVQAAGAGPDFGVYGVVGETETPVAWDTQRSAFSVSSGQRLRFKATGTTGAVSWSFGDGTVATETNPIKYYTEPVDKLLVATLSADGKTKSRNVFVKGSTGAPLTGAYSFVYADGKTVNPSEVEANKPIRFTAADNADTYVWDFGDGSGGSPALVQGSPKEHTFTRGGNFTVKLTTSRTGVTPVTTQSPTTFSVKVTDPLLWVAGGMAYVDGKNGEKFQSDLSIFNPGTETAVLSLAFVSGDGWAGVPADAWKPLPPLLKGETKAFTNVLGGFFGLAKGAFGVVLVRSDSGPVPPVIVSRTYNATNAETKGTFGLSVPVMSVASGVKPGSAAAGGNFLADLRHDASFRTNLTLANLKDETAEVEFVFRNGAGEILGSPARITVEARGVKQVNSVLVAPVAGTGAIGGAGFTGTAAHFSAEVILKKGSGVYPYATVIDAGTGDSIVVTPAPRPSPTYRLPGIVRVKGKNDKYWVSDVAILNPGTTERKVLVTYSYVKSDSTKRLSLSGLITLGAHKLAVLKDFVKEWLELPEDDPNGYISSYVDITPDTDDLSPAEPLVVTGKTYTPSGAGSVGLQVDAFVLEDGLSAQGSSRKLVLSGLEANARYRTNLALFLTPGSTGGAQVDVRVLNALGAESKKISFVGLDPSSPFVQFNSSDLFAGLSTDETSRATVVIDNPRGTGLVGAYATVIDNLSDDATFVAGQLVP